MFLGHYEHSIDSKGRLTFPSKFRPGLEAGAVITLGLDDCLLVFPRAKWEELAAKIAALPITNPDARTFARLMFSNADDNELDGQGRVLIPTYLREYAKLEANVVIAGLSSRIELWNPSRWQEVRTWAVERSGLIAQHFAELGI